MFRITTHDSTGFFTFQLEGRLAGPWVEILRDCWQSHLNRNEGRLVQVDLQAVTFVDAAGKALLAEIAGHNVTWVASDCQMKALVAEIEHTNREFR
jgi:ABC-type transporter Mla MlaB component